MRLLRVRLTRLLKTPGWSCNARRNRIVKDVTKEKIAGGRPKDPSGSRFGALLELKEDAIHEDGRQEETTRGERVVDITGKAEGSDKLLREKTQKKYDDKKSKLGDAKGNKQRTGKSKLVLSLDTREECSGPQQKDKMDVEEITCVPDTPLEIQVGYPSVNGQNMSGINSEKMSEEMKKQGGDIINDVGPIIIFQPKVQMGLKEIIDKQNMETDSNRPNLKLLVDKGDSSREVAMDTAREKMETMEHQIKSSSDVPMIDSIEES